MLLEKFPEHIQLLNLEGETVSLKTFLGQKTLILMWSSW